MQNQKYFKILLCTLMRHNKTGWGELWTNNKEAYKYISRISSVIHFYFWSYDDFVWWYPLELGLMCSTLNFWPHLGHKMSACQQTSREFNLQTSIFKLNRLGVCCNGVWCFFSISSILSLILHNTGRWPLLKILDRFYCTESHSWISDSLLCSQYISWALFKPGVVYYLIIWTIRPICFTCQLFTFLFYFHI